MLRGILIGIALYLFVFVVLNISKKPKGEEYFYNVRCVTFLFSAAITGIAAWFLPKVKFCDLGDVNALKIIAGIEFIAFLVNLAGLYKNSKKTKTAI